MIVFYALLVATMAAGELVLVLRVVPVLKKAQNRSVYLLFLWVGIIPGEVVGAAFIVYMILNRKIATPVQMLVATVVALAIGFLGGGFLLRVKPQLT